MTFVLAAASFSVLVSVLLKLMPRHGIDVGQAVTWNYLAAGLLCLWMLAPPLETLYSPTTPWPALLVLAVVLPSLFLVLAAAVRHAGIVRTDIAQRLSLLLSLIAAFTWFGEPLGAWKLIGLALGLVAVLAILMRSETRAPPARGAMWLLLAVWFGFALVDVMLKAIARAGTPFAASLLAVFVLAFAGMLALQLWRHAAGRHLRLRHFAAGLLLGVLNFGNIVCYVRAHRALPESPAVVFATMNIGVVVLGTLVGVLMFGERTSRWNRLGIALAIVAIALIAFSPQP
ncbi:DMT family transporter [Xanthomonadaceae bacterium JHOS43]|nr:DMT family transporter [Xanthomonadaceae bacterium JHOS43]MCX7562274.1 DMT family transporter [Xanthomonadaceae bacterium XH05]